jgi:hypothetical protein
MYLSPESPSVKNARIESISAEQSQTNDLSLEDSLESKRDIVLSYLGNL